SGLGYGGNSWTVFRLAGWPAGQSGVQTDARKFASGSRPHKEPNTRSPVPLSRKPSKPGQTPTRYWRDRYSEIGARSRRRIRPTPPAIGRERRRVQTSAG